MINEQLNNSPHVNEHFRLQIITLQMCQDSDELERLLKRRQKEEAMHIENIKLVTKEIGVLKPVLYRVARSCRKRAHIIRHVTLSLREGFCRWNHHDFFNQFVAC